MPTSTRMRGALSAVLLLAATIGLPLALATTVGNPLHSWPSLRAGQLSDTDMIAILATIFWIAWLSFAVPALLEISLAVRARITRRPLRELRIPMLGSQQDLARNLISAVLLLLPAQTATGVPAASHVHAAPTIHISETAWSAPSAAQSNHHTPHTSAGSQHERTYVIPETGGMRNYWALAEHYLGDGARWREIWDLNEGRTHADGAVMDSPRQLYAGWTILIPSADHHGPPRQHETTDPATPQSATVEPGDTLSGIAAAHGITDWQKVWEANADREEPNGQQFTDPNLIDPGWTLTLPSTLHADPRRSTSDAAPNGRHQSEQQPTEPNKPPPAGHTTVTPSEAGSPTPPSTSGRAGSQTSSTLPTAPPTPTESAPRPTVTNPADEEHHHSPAVPLGIGLGAAAALVVLDRARRIAQRRRRVGHRIAPSPPALRQAEADLRNDAAQTRSTASAVELALHLAACTPVTIRAVIARNDGAVDLRLIEEDSSPVPPFIPVTGGWRLPADAAQYGFAVDDCDDPHPLFTPIGSTSDGEILLDLATDPVIITGPDTDVRPYLTHLAAAIAGAPWAMRVQVHVPPWLATAVGPLDRVSSDDATCPRPPASASNAIATGQEEPGWRTAPIYLYCGWSTDDHLEPLLAATANPASNVYALLRTDQDGADSQTWNLDGNQLKVPGIIETITVILPRLDATATVDLVAHERSAPDLPVGHPELPNHDADAAPSQPHALGNNPRPATATQPNLPVGHAEHPNHDADVPPSQPHALGNNPRPITATRHVLDNEASPPPDEAETVLDSDQPRRLLLLGPVELTGTGKLRRAQVLNVLTFLALHRRGVSRDQFIEAMWPKQTPSGQTVRNRLVDSRALVDGAITEGPPWRLDESITTDWQEFTVLAAGSPDQQRQALQLIRGRPFDGLDDAHWLHLEGFRSEVEAAIVDVALTVAERDLDNGNYPGALAAARKGLLASRYEERVHRAGIRAALAQGLDGIADTLETEMRIALDLDIEPDDTVQPETLALARARRQSRSTQPIT
ncbi:MAG TPA: LysM peptidoglycan-binding domain-containing protein [Mycobacteriales bacterium]|nr:LysM peptidoglycan-binding domain-containing protein [Mycobacteriales bacterium]